VTTVADAQTLLAALVERQDYWRTVNNLPNVTRATAHLAFIEWDAVFEKARAFLAQPEAVSGEIDAPLNRVLDELRIEVSKARSKHAPMNSPHEGWAVILEELTPELWEHVCGDTGRSPEARHEALQVAAMGVRYILDLIDDPPAAYAAAAQSAAAGEREGT
jgi:hypothetical protein